MANYSELSDLELLNNFQSGNTDGFVQLYDRYWLPSVIHANNMVRDQNLAEDIVQEVFTWIFKFASKLVITTSFKSYLYTSVRNGVFNAIRLNKSKVNYLDSIAKFSPSTYNAADQDLHLKELIAIVEAAIDHLPPKTREVFIMSRKQHLSYKEIGEILGISENTVDTQIRRALKILRSNRDINGYVLLIAMQLFR